ncbi:MAG: DNA repair protein RecO [Microthrixaceae bacterium]|nr:DNA repair protein RecO [Microthrixaceae bacterium]MCO5313066.1 DNA repair protein RecO [Microthrixaceae bacterium]
MALYRDVGVVLRTYKLGEADRIVVFCTQGRGKVRAVAKGVRKTRSRFGGRLEPGCHVVAQFYEGRGDLDIVSQVDLVESPAPLREDLDRMGRVAAMLEAVDQMSQEGEQSSALYDLLVGGLRAVANWDTPLVTPSFYCKLLANDGVGLVVDGCVECGSPDDLVSLDLNAGGLRCREHREGISVSSQAVLILQLILGGRLAQALKLPIGAATFEVDHLASMAMERHLDRRLRSVHLLDER